MSCNHDDCFTCPYPDCVHDAKARRPKLTPEERKERRKAYLRRYYMEHKENLAEEAHKRYLRKKYNGLFI